MARTQVAHFPEDLPVILPSGSCAGMMKVHYPELFHGQPDEDLVRAFSDRVYELTQFLVDVLEVRLQDLGEPVKVTWHSGCHSVRDLGLRGQPQDKAADAEATGASVLHSADGGCLLNVSGALEAKHSRMPVQHIAEVLWERTRAR